jgi:hypothetical protein
MTTRNWLREPLLHFLLLGAGLFLLYHWVRGGETSAPGEIVVTEARAEALAENFAKTWMRPPSAQELRGLVDDYVKDEVFYRESIAIGLDRDDTVIRRRLRQKMEFVSEDVAESRKPTEAELQQFLDAHADKFVSAPTLTFQQVFLSTDRRGASARGEAEKLLSALQSGKGPADPAEAGDPTMLPPSMEQATPQEIANTFGEAFSADVESAPVGQWTGPYESAYGLHLVRVATRTPAKQPTLAEIRPSVLREWQAAQRQQVNDAFYDSLRSKYDVRYEGELGKLLAQAPAPAQTSPPATPAARP